MSLQSITFHESDYQAQLRGELDQQYIFPGGVLPSLAAIEGDQPDDLWSGAVGHRAPLRGDAAAWRARFLSKREASGDGFDERFIRTGSTTLR